MCCSKCVDGCGECVPQLKKPHKHAALIKAWADGAVIECKQATFGNWYHIPIPSWGPETEYRIKPEPKPDVVVNATMTFTHSWKTPKVFSSWNGPCPVGYRHQLDDKDMKQVQFTIDSESGELKAVVVLKG